MEQTLLEIIPRDKTHVSLPGYLSNGQKPGSVRKDYSMQRELPGDSEDDEIERLTPEQAKKVEGNLGLIRFALRNHPSLWMNRLDEEEAFQVGSLGLMRAAQKYDPMKGQFSTYALWWIKQSLRVAVRCSQQIIIPQNIWDEINRLIQIQRDFTKKNGKDPSMKETAERMGCDPQKVRMLLETKQRLEQRMLSLEQPLSEEDETWLGDLIAAPETQEQEWLEQKELISRLFEHLMPVERQVMILRYHLQEEGLSEERKKDQYPRPYEVISDLTGHTKKFVRMREHRAILKLRGAMAQLARAEREEAPRSTGFR